MTEASAPIALFIFNRPETTARVLERIADARPSRLLVVSDGPRTDRPDEVERCRQARALIEAIDWPCEVVTNHADTNLGCRRRLSSGLDWIFSQAESAIILEDDCLPDPTFFPFCQELLERYRDDERVMMISGDNFQPAGRESPYSYYYSRFPHVWGWASWRRAWRLYDVSIARWPEVRMQQVIEDIVGNRRSARAWRAIFDAVHAGKIDTWDYQLTFACWMQNGLAILPEVNLVSNIGFGAAATHTTGESPVANLPTTAMSFPLRHPPFMFRDRAADALTASIFGEADLLTRARRRLRRLVGAAQPDERGAAGAR